MDPRKLKQEVCPTWISTPFSCGSFQTKTVAPVQSMIGRNLIYQLSVQNQWGTTWLWTWPLWSFKLNPGKLIRRFGQLEWKSLDKLLVCLMMVRRHLDPGNRVVHQRWWYRLIFVYVLYLHILISPCFDIVSKSPFHSLSPTCYFSGDLICTGLI